MIRLREREREECYRKERGRSVIVARNGEGKWSVRGERERGGRRSMSWKKEEGGIDSEE